MTESLRDVVLIIALVAMVTNIVNAVVFAGWVRVVSILAACAAFFGALLLFNSR